MTFPSSETTRASGVVRATLWVIGVVALLAAAIGAYLALAPEDGSLTIINQTWAVSELRDTWARALLIGGGAVALLSGGLVPLLGQGDRSAGGLTIPAVVLAVCGVVSVGAGLFLLP